IELILYNRGLVKLNSTYVQNLFERLEQVDDDIWILTGYRYNHIGTRTGRLSCLNPNQQNQPRGKKVLRMLFLKLLKQHGIIKSKITFLTDEKLAEIYNEDEGVVGEKYKKYEKKIKKIAELTSID